MESPTDWTTDQDFLICSILLEHGLESVELGLEWIQELFTPLPVELFGRTHGEIASRIKHLQPTLLDFLRSKKRFSGSELRKWLETEACCSSSFVVVFNARTSLEKELKEEMEPSSGCRAASMIKKRQESTESLPLSVSYDDGLEPKMKKTRSRYCKYSFVEDKCICMKVAKAMLEGTESCFGQSWFQVNVVNSGLVTTRTCDSLYGRFKRTLHLGILSAVREAQSRCLSKGLSLSFGAVEKVLLEWLHLLHPKGEVVEVMELIQVELDL